MKSRFRLASVQLELLKKKRLAREASSLGSFSNLLRHCKSGQSPSSILASGFLSFIYFSLKILEKKVMNGPISEEVFLYKKLSYKKTTLKVLFFAHFFSLYGGFYLFFTLIDSIDSILDTLLKLIKYL